jgi:hypothetical protein
MPPSMFGNNNESLAFVAQGRNPGTPDSAPYKPLNGLGEMQWHTSLGGPLPWNTVQTGNEKWVHHDHSMKWGHAVYPDGSEKCRPGFAHAPVLTRRHPFSLCTTHTFASRYRGTIMCALVDQSTPMAVQATKVTSLRAEE